jgi:hypothetical protein
VTTHHCHTCADARAALATANERAAKAEAERDEAREQQRISEIEAEIAWHDGPPDEVASLAKRVVEQSAEVARLTAANEGLAARCAQLATAVADALTLESLSQPHYGEVLDRVRAALATPPAATIPPEMVRRAQQFMAVMEPAPPEAPCEAPDYFDAPPAATTQAAVCARCGGSRYATDHDSGGRHVGWSVCPDCSGRDGER